MQVTPLPHGLDLTATDLVRSSGLHMSDIYGSLYRFLEPKRYDAGGAPNPLLLALGTAWENHLEYLLAKNGVEVVRPGELVTTDGTNIAYSPDGLLVAEDRLVEYKLSSMGTDGLPTTPENGLPAKFDKYLCQMMAYCYHLGLSKARLYFLSLRQPWNPDLRVFDLTFTERELQENWQLLRSHAEQEGLLT